MSDMTVTEAAAAGDTLALLIATRNRIAQAVEDEKTPARDLAALTKRLAEVMREIEAQQAARAEADAKAEQAHTYDDDTFSAEAL